MKNFFSYFTSIKVIAVMMIFGIFVGTAGYVFAQVYSASISVHHRASDLTSGTVNVTPNGSTNIDADTARASYIISYTDVKTLDKTDEAPGLLVQVPIEAKDIQFTLIGTSEKAESEFMTSDGKYTEKSTNVNFPLTVKTIHDPREVFTDKSILMPTAEEINAGTANANIVMYPELPEYELRQIGRNFYSYYLPRLHSAHPVAVRLDYTIDKKTVAQHAPIRAFKTELCYALQSVVSEPSVVSGPVREPLTSGVYGEDGRPIPEFDVNRPIVTISGPVCSTIRTESNGYTSLAFTNIPDMADISVGDFDDHGLYLGSDQCSVTRNLSRWDKIGVDITPVTVNLFQKFNLFAKSKVYYGATPSEDLCDQAAVTIPAK